jgi:para-nitrobenzyl esterase
MRRSLFVMIAVVGFVASGCALVAPTGPAPLRYRDAVFTGVTVTKDVTYGSAVNQQGQTVSLKLDVYQPTNDSVKARPAIVWVHGGSFCCLDKTSPELVDEANAFSTKGYVNVSIDYRLDPNGCSASAATGECVAEIADATHDAQAAVRFLRANATTYRVDPRRIAIGGTSAGAIVALNVAYSHNDVGTSGNPGYSSTVGAAAALSGAKILGTIMNGDPEALLFHGTADSLVPYAWAKNTVAEAQKVGVVDYLITWQGEGHAPYAQHRDEILTDETNFFYNELGLATAAR